MHARNAVRSIEKTLTLADSPYTVLPYIYNVIKVDTTGGNVRVNLPDANYPIDVIKTSSDAYIVTVWVGGVQIGEVAGPMSKITVENAEVTKDEPRYPYDAIILIAGVPGDGGEVLAKDKFGRVIARGVAGTDDDAIRDIVFASYDDILLVGSHHWTTAPTFRSNLKVRGHGIENTMIYLDADVSLDFVDCNYSSFGNCSIYVFNGYASSVLKISAVSSGCTYNSLHDIFIKDSYYAHAFNVIELLVSNDDKYILENRFTNINSDPCTRFVWLHSTCDTGWINANYFADCWCRGFETFVDFDALPTSTDLANGNQFVSIRGQTRDYAKDGFKNVWRYHNSFVDCYIWDWHVATSPNYEWSIDSRARWTNIISADGYFNSARCIDSGVDTRVMTPDWGSPSTPMTKVVASEWGNFKTLSAALTSLADASSLNRYTVYVIGKVIEHNIITARDYVDVIGINAEIVSDRDGDSVYFNGTANTVWRNIRFKKTGACTLASSVANINLASNTVIIENCTFTNEATGNVSQPGVTISNGNPIFSRCTAIGSSGSSGSVFNCGWWIIGSSGGQAILKNCIGYGSSPTSSTSSAGFCIMQQESPVLKQCIAYPGAANNSRGIELHNSCSPSIVDCTVEPPVSAYSFVYASADGGKFRPFTGKPYQIFNAILTVSVASVGVTIAIGTTPGGSDVASGISIASTGLKYFTVTRKLVASDGYLYITPSSPISEGSVTLRYQTVYAYTGMNAIYSNSVGPYSIIGGYFVSNGNSDTLYYTSVRSVYAMINHATIENLGSIGNAINASSTYSTAPLYKCELRGGVGNVATIGACVLVDYKVNNSGSSTGTGSEQTIAHGLAAIPTGCKAWITYLVGTRYVTEMIPFDATNVYPTVDNGVAYAWRIE